ncbi:hypothetical protein [Aeoliella sp.]|uniref:hypothetical protein n=1 Tax=Aeoliella sp. TaxID=2795800 RepID=UPI003CCBA81B
MKITFGSYLQASQLLQADPRVWDAIAILDSDLALSPRISDFAQRHVVLRFDDITSAEQCKRLVEQADVLRAMEFVEESEACVVTCRAGQSRSAALAFALAYHLIGADAAAQLLNPRRHIPNLKVAEVASAALQNPAILQALVDWKHAHRDYRLADYYDEIEAEYDELERESVVNCVSER